jgi:choline-glycine betaine transporter
MTVGRIIVILIGCLILGVIAGLITRNIIVAITFPLLLLGFLLMWRNLKQNPPEDVEKERPQEKQEQNQEQDNPKMKVEIKQEVTKVQPQVRKTQPQPPVSTNYPPIPPEL